MELKIQKTLYPDLTFKAGEMIHRSRFMQYAAGAWMEMAKNPIIYAASKPLRSSYRAMQTAETFIKDFAIGDPRIPSWRQQSTTPEIVYEMFERGFVPKASEMFTTSGKMVKDAIPPPPTYMGSRAETIAEIEKFMRPKDKGGMGWLPTYEPYQ